MPAKWDFIVIGGGASGMAAAIASAKLGDRVLLLEKSSALGRKIAASGNGRCNLMNTGDPVYYGDAGFAADVFMCYPKENLIGFWKDAGLFLTEEEAGRVYPRTFHSSSVLEALKAMLRMYHVEIMLQTAVTGIRKDCGLFVISSGAGSFSAGRILIAAGGSAYPRLGGSDDGYAFLHSFGHRIIDPFPALCPLCTDAKSISGLSGIRIRCRICLTAGNNRELFSTRGEVLFTDYGISGICAMQCARFYEEGCIIRLNLVDGLFDRQDKLIQALHTRRKQFSGFPPEYILNGILVPKLSFAVMKQAGINLRDRNAGSLSDEEIKQTAHVLTGYTLYVTGTRGFAEAQVTAGGADCTQFDPNTLESRIVKGLHASGEVLNVDGDCGGYNLMFAAATGLLAGSNGRTGKETGK